MDQHQSIQTNTQLPKRTDKKIILFGFIILLLIVALYFLFRPPLMYRLARKYYEAPLPQIRAANPPVADSIYLEGMSGYAQQEWRRALAAFEKVPADHRFYERSLFYAGHAYAGLKDFRKALNLFSNTAFDDGQYIDQAEWNETLMKMFLEYPEPEVLAALDSLQVNPNQTIKSKSREIIDRLTK